MKKRYLILAGILAASMLAAGCGKKNSVAPEQKVEATVTPTVTEAAKTDVVEMQTSTDDTANIKNVMGTKTETTTSIVFTNKMGSTISAIYEGEIVVLKGYVTYVGRTSMEVEIDTYVEQPDGIRRTVNRAFFVMVAVDKDQKPIQVPELIITTEAEKARNEAAKMRRDMRKKRRENGF